MSNEKRMDKVMGLVEVITENRYLKAVSKAMVMTIPATMTGALFTLINNVPFEGYQTFLVESGLKTMLQIPGLFTMNILALIVVYFVALNLVKSFNLDGTVAGILGIICFLIFTPLASIDVNNDGNLVHFISYDWIGSRGMFVGLILGLVIGRLYAFFMIKRIYIRMPSSVPSFVEKSFASLIPFISIVTLSSIVSWLLTFTNKGHLHQIIFTFLQAPLQQIGGTIGGVLVAYVVINLLWWFGIHGKAVVFAVVAPIWTSLSIENMNATAAGEIPPHLIDLGFTTIFIEIGGAGAVIGLALLFMFLAKSERYRNIGRLTFIPTFFGINEPITFGTPIVLNPYFLVPTILVPLVTGIIGYTSILIGFVPRMSGVSLPTGVPVIANSLILAGWRGMIVQLIAIAVSVAIYYPFFRAADKKALKEEKSEEEKINNIELETVASI